MAADSTKLFPGVWKWKSEGYTNICTDYIKSLPPKDRKNVDFPNIPGYFEAGSMLPNARPLLDTMLSQWTRLQGARELTCMPPPCPYTVAKLLMFVGFTGKDSAP